MTRIEFKILMLLFQFLNQLLIANGVSGLSEIAPRLVAMEPEQTIVQSWLKNKMVETALAQ